MAPLWAVDVEVVKARRLQGSDPPRARVSVAGEAVEFATSGGTAAEPLWEDAVLTCPAQKAPAPVTVEMLDASGAVTSFALLAASATSTDWVPLRAVGSDQTCGEVMVRTGPVQEDLTGLAQSDLEAAAAHGEAVLGFAAGVMASLTGRSYKAAGSSPITDACESSSVRSTSLLLLVCASALLPLLGDSAVTPVGRALLPLTLLVIFRSGVSAAQSCHGALDVLRHRGCVAKVAGGAEGLSAVADDAAIRSAVLAAAWVRRATSFHRAALRSISSPATVCAFLLAALCSGLVQERVAALILFLVCRTGAVYVSAAISGLVESVPCVEPAAADLSRALPAADSVSAGDTVHIVHEIENEDGSWESTTGVATVVRVDDRGVWVRFEENEEGDPLYCSPHKFVTPIGSAPEAIRTDAQVDVWFEEEDEEGAWNVVSAPGRVVHVEEDTVVVDWGDGSALYRCNRRFVGVGGRSEAETCAAERRAGVLPEVAPAAAAAAAAPAPAAPAAEPVDVWYEEEEEDGTWLLRSAKARIRRHVDNETVEVAWADDDGSPPFTIKTRFVGDSGRAAAEAARVRPASPAPPPPGISAGDTVVVKHEVEGNDGEWEEEESLGRVLRCDAQGVWVRFLEDGDAEEEPYCSPPQHVRPHKRGPEALRSPAAVPRQAPAVFEPGDAVEVDYEVEDSENEWRRDSAPAHVVRTEATGVWVQWDGGDAADAPYCSPWQHVRRRIARAGSVKASSHRSTDTTRRLRAAAKSAVAIATCPKPGCGSVQSKRWRGSNSSAVMRCSACGYSGDGWVDAVRGADPRAAQFRVGDSVEAWYEEEVADGQWAVTSDAARIVALHEDGQVDLRWEGEADDAELYHCHTRFLASPQPTIAVGATVEVQYDEQDAAGEWHAVSDTGRVRSLQGDRGVEVDWGDGSDTYLTSAKHVRVLADPASSPSGTQ
eukprot:TRINITY_DN8749_c0_g1_i1.p1 TRINITY_DN8749_c0_g1~~TRINITY_DN8749_c0_g1_i1.p1  ORF type:complete len:942 (+),score=325.44 TRINITY_DN8749_c0_g1_i1:61-2886(+)